MPGGITAMLDINDLREGGVPVTSSCCRWTTDGAAACINSCVLHAGKGGNPELVRESQRRRFADVVLIDAVIAQDARWRDGDRHRPGQRLRHACHCSSAEPPPLRCAATYRTERLRTEFNALNKEVGQRRKVSIATLHIGSPLPWSQACIELGLHLLQVPDLLPGGTG